MTVAAEIPRGVRFLAFVLRPWLNRVPLPADGLDRIREANNDGKVVYLMRSESWLDYLAWQSICRRARVPEPVFANSNTQVVPNGAHLRLRSPEQGEFDPLEQLVREAGDGGAAQHIHLFPIAPLWNVQPRSIEKSLFEIIFGPRDSAGLFRRAVWLLLRARNAKFVVAKRVVLHEFVGESKDPAPVLTRKIRLSVRYHLAGEEKGTLGPRLLRRRRLMDRVLRDKTLTAVMRDVAAEQGRAVTDVQADVEKILDEIAADYRWSYVRFLEFVLSRFWRRMYDDFQIDLEGMERVRELARTDPVLLVPAHRSHMDYLVISYFFKINNIVTPHIAAGINLSFFPLGYIFRRCGAFFLRRSFVGDRLYESTLKTYIKILLREQYNIEFFIEGTRSRSGKIMQPKFGMLSMIMDAHDEMSGDVQIVPVSIDYESLVEEASMVREAQGGKKKSESVGGLIKARQTLNKKYGTVYLKFGDSFTLGEVREKFKDSEPRKQVRQVAYEILEAIQQSVTVTSTSLVAASIVVHHKRGIRRPVLLERIQLIQEAVQRKGGFLASDFPTGSLDPDRALALLIRNKVVRLIEIQGETVYSVDDNSRMALDYYKNAMIHFLVNTSFACLAFRVSREDTLDSLWQGYHGLHEIFVEEFHTVNRRPAIEDLRAELDWLSQKGFLTQDGDTWRVQDPVAIMAFENVTRNFLESAYIAIMTLLESGDPEQARDLKEWTQLTMDMGDLLYARGDIWRIESRNAINLQNALSSFRHSGLLVETDFPIGVRRRRGQKPPFRISENGVARLNMMRDLLAEILQETQLN